MKKERKQSVSWNNSEYRLIDVGMMSIDHVEYKHCDPQDISVHSMVIHLDIKTAHYGRADAKDAIIVQGRDATGKITRWYFWKANHSISYNKYWVSHRKNKNKKTRVREHTYWPIHFGYICGEVMKEAIITAADNHRRAKNNRAKENRKKKTG